MVENEQIQMAAMSIGNHVKKIAQTLSSMGYDITLSDSRQKIQEALRILETLNDAMEIINK
jgi:UDP-N-acetylglucosamine transferase subunit ALG13